MKRILQFTAFILTLPCYSQVDTLIYAPVNNIQEMGWVGDKTPEPICGLDSLTNWIDINNTLMNKSDTIAEKQFVAVQVWVDTTGNLSDIGVIRGMGKPYDQEAYRLLSECPIRWIPGELRKKKNTSNNTCIFYKKVIITCSNRSVYAIGFCTARISWSK